MQHRALALSLSLLGGFAAYGNPIEFQGSIDSGHAGRYGQFFGLVSGSDFSIFLSSAAPFDFGPLSPGSHSLIDSASADGTNLASGHGGFDLDGTHYGCSVTFTGQASNCVIQMDLSFVLTVPSEHDPGMPFNVSAPFTAEASLVFSDPSCGGVCFHLDAFGYGLASASLESTGRDVDSVRFVGYQFTPEPATLILSGFGLFAVMLLHRRARRPSQA